MTVRGDSGGETTLSVSINQLDNDSGGKIQATADDGTVTVKSDETGPTVGVTDIELTVGESEKTELSLSEAPDGLAGFDITVGIETGEIGTITAGSVDDQFGLTDKTVTDTEVRLVGSDTNENVGKGESDIRLGSLTVQAESKGKTTLDVTINKLDDDAGESIDATTADGQITVTEGDSGGPPALPGRENPPQDPDGDGRYEDLNGDGELSIVDVQLYFTEIYQQRNSAYVQNNRQYFDYTGDGEISIADVQLLFQESQNSNSTTSGSGENSGEYKRQPETSGCPEPTIGECGDSRHRKHPHIQNSR